MYSLTLYSDISVTMDSNSQQPDEANITDMLDISYYGINTQQAGTQRFATGRE